MPLGDYTPPSGSSSGGGTYTAPESPWAFNPYMSGAWGHGGRYGPAPGASPSASYGPATAPGSRGWLTNALGTIGDYTAGFGAAYGNLLGQPQYVQQMADLNNAGWANLFGGLMANSNYNQGVGSAYGNYNLGLQGIGLDRDKINYQLGTLGRDTGFLNKEKGYIDQLRALLGRDFNVTTGELNRTAKMKTTLNDSDYTSRGAYFAPFRRYKNVNIEAERKAGIEQADIARDRGNISLDQQLNSIDREIAGLTDRRFDLNNAAQRLGLDEQRLAMGLNDTLRQLGLDQFLTLNDLASDRSKLTAEQGAFYNSLLQLAFQNLAANPDYWVDQATPTSAGYHRPVKPVL